MSSIPNQSNADAVTPGWNRRDTLYLIVSLLIGIAGAGFHDLSASGLSPSGIEAPIGLLVPVWMVLLFGYELVCRRSLRGILWPPFALFLVVTSWALTSAVLPDAAWVYYKLRRTYIEANWKTDPQSGIIYFPLAYESFDNWATEVPRVFFVFDKYAKLRFVPFSDQLSWPYCPQGNFYTAHKVAESVYWLRAYIDDPGDDARPCAIAPVPTSPDKHD